MKGYRGVRGLRVNLYPPGMRGIHSSQRLNIQLIQRTNGDFPLTHRTLRDFPVALNELVPLSPSSFQCHGCRRITRASLCLSFVPPARYFSSSPKLSKDAHTSAHEMYEKLANSVAKLEQSTKFHGYSMLKIGGFLLLFSGSVLYLFNLFNSRDFGIIC